VAQFELNLQAGEFRNITVQVTTDNTAERVPLQFAKDRLPPSASVVNDAVVGVRTAHEDWRLSCTRIASDHERFNALLDRDATFFWHAVRDLKSTTSAARSPEKFCTKCAS
jgi:hypothetical protein